MNDAPAQDPAFPELSESGRISATEVAGDINEIVDEHGDVGLAALCLAVAETHDALAARPDLNATELEAHDRLARGCAAPTVKITLEPVDSAAFDQCVSAWLEGHAQRDWISVAGNAPPAAEPSVASLHAHLATIRRIACGGEAEAADGASVSPAVVAVRVLRQNFERQVVELADAAKRERALRDRQAVDLAYAAKRERALRDQAARLSAVVAAIPRVARGGATPDEVKDSPTVEYVRKTYADLRQTFENQRENIVALHRKVDDLCRHNRRQRDTIVANEARIAELERELAKPLGVRAALINDGVGKQNWAIQLTRDGEPVPNSGAFVSP